MFSSHDPVTDPALLQAHFAVAPPAAAAPPPGVEPEAWQPCLLRIEPAQTGLLGEARWALHGLLPRGAADLGVAQGNTHCRVEAMKSAPAFRESWWAGRRCLVPAWHLSTWRQDGGGLRPWHVESTEPEPLALAGLWNLWEGGGESVLSFTLLTLPAAGHALFGGPGAPADDARMPAILPRSAHLAWLYGSLNEAAALLRPCPATALTATPQALPHPAPREPASWAAVPDMFAPEWLALAATQPAPRRSRLPRAPQRPQPSSPGPTTADLF